MITGIKVIPRADSPYNNQYITEVKAYNIYNV